MRFVYKEHNREVDSFEHTPSVGLYELYDWLVGENYLPDEPSVECDVDSTPTRFFAVLVRDERASRGDSTATPAKGEGEGEEGGEYDDRTVVFCTDETWKRDNVDMEAMDVLLRPGLSHCDWFSERFSIMDEGDDMVDEEGVAMVDKEGVAREARERKLREDMRRLDADCEEASLGGSNATKMVTIFAQIEKQMLALDEDCQGMDRDEMDSIRMDLENKQGLIVQCIQFENELLPNVNKDFLRDVRETCNEKTAESATVRPRVADYRPSPLRPPLSSSTSPSRATSMAVHRSGLDEDWAWGSDGMLVQQAHHGSGHRRGRVDWNKWGAISDRVSPAVNSVRATDRSTGYATEIRVAMGDLCSELMALRLIETVMATPEIEAFEVVVRDSVHRWVERVFGVNGGAVATWGRERRDKGLGAKVEGEWGELVAHLVRPAITLRDVEILGRLVHGIDAHAVGMLPGCVRGLRGALRSSLREHSPNTPLDTDRVDRVCDEAEWTMGLAARHGLTSVHGVTWFMEAVGMDELIDCMEEIRHKHVDYPPLFERVNGLMHEIRAHAMANNKEDDAALANHMGHLRGCYAAWLCGTANEPAAFGRVAADEPAVDETELAYLLGEAHKRLLSRDGINDLLLFEFDYMHRRVKRLAPPGLYTVSVSGGYRVPFWRLFFDAHAKKLPRMDIVDETSLVGPRSIEWQRLRLALMLGPMSNKEIATALHRVNARSVPSLELHYTVVTVGGENVAAPTFLAYERFEADRSMDVFFMG